MDIIQSHTITQIRRHKKLLEYEDLDISLNKILNSKPCQTIIETSRKYRDRIYGPLETLTMFIKQVINPDKSCRKAVAGNVIKQMLLKDNSASCNTGPYCKARKRLPEKMVRLLVQETRRTLVNKTPNHWKWKGKEIKIVDGTTLMMPDTIANQSIFPQHGNQGKGLGFPMASLVTIISWATGVVIDYTIGSYKGKGNGELSLFRTIIDCIGKKDILLADRFYASYFIDCRVTGKSSRRAFLWSYP